MNAVERHCTCGASLRAKATSSLIVDRVADLFSDYHTGAGHGTATAQQARNARRREERALAQGSCVMTSPTEAPPAPEADGWVRVADLLPSRARDLPWTWGDEERNTLTRQCLCCGRPGHYQQTLEAHDLRILTPDAFGSAQTIRNHQARALEDRAAHIRSLTQPSTEEKR